MSRWSETPARPRFTISIDGPPTLSLSNVTYPLTATLLYHATTSSPTITFNVFGTPIHQHASFGDYLFYYAESAKEGEAAEVYPTDFELADLPVPVCLENDFATFSSRTGKDSVWRELSLPAEIYDLLVGCKYRLSLPSGVIIRPTQVRHADAGEIINIPESNSIDITIVE
ncbi:MAG: hypothetical protein LQ346_000779 [Caloplaca aetnensis]|nr:MAG: hypothetical protein LQ346_000779 [Caloplaca aetnensis]